MLAMMATSKTAKVRAKSELTKVGDDAKAKAQKALLLKTLKANRYNLSAVAEALNMGPATAVSRALRTLAPVEYEAAKAAGLISQGNRRE